MRRAVYPVLDNEAAVFSPHSSLLAQEIITARIHIMAIEWPWIGSKPFKNLSGFSLPD